MSNRNLNIPWITAEGHIDLTRKAAVVDALSQVWSDQTARLLFDELERTESSNTIKSSNCDRVEHAKTRAIPFASSNPPVSLRQNSHSTKESYV